MSEISMVVVVLHHSLPCREVNQLSAVADNDRWVGIIIALYTFHNGGANCSKQAC